MHINISMNCINCNGPLTKKWQTKFCSSSCSASHNNKLRLKKYKGSCLECGEEVKRLNNKFCSLTCCRFYHSPYNTDQERLDASRKLNRENNARYIAQKKFQTPVDADLTAIKEFYKKCPDGYEVDHKIPVSKGGAHSIENLQYLTISENRKKGATWPA